LTAAESVAVAKRSKQRAGARRTSVLLRWSLLGTAVLVAFLYYRPLASYLETRSSVQQRAAEVRVLHQEKTRLEARLADSTTLEALAREARRMGLVRPGERLYIVKGIKEWRRAQASKQTGTTIPGDG
jgi:cell division protein FtsB